MTAPTMVTEPGVRQRFSVKVDISGGTNACHIWTGAKSGGGYGQIRVNGRTAPGYARHRRHGEPTCMPCRAAVAKYNRGRKAARP